MRVLIRMDKFCFNAFILLSVAIAFAASERIYIVSSPNQPCPTQSTDESCFTLQQYFIENYMYTRNKSAPAPSNITLELLSGTHSLLSYFRISDTDSVEMRSENATIICNTSSGFFFRDVQTVQISGIKFIDCRQVLFYNVHTLSIENSTIQNHYSWFISSVASTTIVRTSFMNGFTLELSSSSALIKQSSFINSTTMHTCDDGGAINFAGDVLTIEETIFKNNSAIGTTCSPTYLRGRGGAIYTRNTEVRISSSTFFGNTATFSGGANYVDGGSVEIFNSLFSFNSGGEYAGALSYSYRDGGITSISRSDFNNNVAGMKGGALYMSNTFYSYDVTVLLSESNFSYNSVSEQSGEGGVAYIIDTRSFRPSSISIFQSSFTHNTAPGNAGVLHTDVANLNVKESFFKSNRAGSNGGVFHVNTSSRNIYISLNQSLFTSNKVIEDGGVMYVKIKKTTSWRDDNSVLNIYDSNFTFNTAIRSGGIIAIFEGQLDIDKAQICCNNTANFGGVIKACNSEVMMQEKLFTRDDPTDMQCTLYDSLHAINSPSTTHPSQPAPISCDNSSIHHSNAALIGIIVLLLVLILVLSTILMCITCYLCVFKHQVGARSKVTNRSVYVPMNESKGRQD